MIHMQNRVMKATKAITARAKGESGHRSAILSPRDGRRELEQQRDLGSTYLGNDVASLWRVSPFLSMSVRHRIC